MPGRQQSTFDGVELRASPDFWLRRWSHFPFYFESTNPSFRVVLTRITEGIGDKRDFPPQFTIRSDKGGLRQLLDATGSRRQPLLFPILKVGEHVTVKIPSVYGYAGDTNHIILALSADGKEFFDIYWYDIRPEEHLWLASVSLLAFALGIAVTLLVGLLVANK